MKLDQQKTHEKWLDYTEMRILRWKMDITKKDEIRYKVFTKK